MASSQDSGWDVSVVEKIRGAYAARDSVTLAGAERERPARRRERAAPDAASTRFGFFRFMSSDRQHAALCQLSTYFGDQP